MTDIIKFIAIIEEMDKLSKYDQNIPTEILTIAFYLVHKKLYFKEIISKSLMTTCLMKNPSMN